MSAISKLTPIIIVEDDGAHYPIRGGGYNEYILPSEFLPILEELQEYCMYYTDDEISEINAQKIKNFYAPVTNKHNKKADYTGYIYLLKCADKYKIGYSKNVARRLRELDTRPFKTELLFAVYSTNARGIEKELHNKLQVHRETGEWYSGISELIVKQTIKEITEELKCDIQF